MLLVFKLTEQIEGTSPNLSRTFGRGTHSRSLDAFSWFSRLVLAWSYLMVGALRQYVGFYRAQFWIVAA